MSVFPFHCSFHPYHSCDSCHSNHSWHSCLPFHVFTILMIIFCFLSFLSCLWFSSCLSFLSLISCFLLVSFAFFRVISVIPRPAQTSGRKTPKWSNRSNFHAARSRKPFGHGVRLHRRKYQHRECDIGKLGWRSVSVPHVRRRLGVPIPLESQWFDARQGRMGVAVHDGPNRLGPKWRRQKRRQNCNTASLAILLSATLSTLPLATLPTLVSAALLSAALFSAILFSATLNCFQLPQLPALFSVTLSTRSHAGLSYSSYSTYSSLSSATLSYICYSSLSHSRYSTLSFTSYSTLSQPPLAILNPATPS